MHAYGYGSLKKTAHTCDLNVCLDLRSTAEEKDTPVCVPFRTQSKQAWWDEVKVHWSQQEPT